MMEEDRMSSPERSKSVKVTYSGRRKKRRDSVASHAEDTPDDATDDQETKDGGLISESDGGLAKGTGKQKAMPKKVNVPLPGPSPTRAKRENHDSPVSGKKPISKVKKASHSRASSIAANAVDIGDEKGPYSPAKPASITGSRKPKSQISSSPQTPDAAADDRSSIGESIGESSKASSRVRKSEAERMEFLQSDPHSGEVEPHRVFCTACKAWVGLNPKRRYVMALWITHRKQCGKKYTHYEKPDPSDFKSDAGAEDDDDSISISLPRPSKRIATAQRKLQLVNDAQVKKFTDHSVECSLCGVEIQLEGELEYDLTNWEDHKTTCFRNMSPSKHVSSSGASAVSSVSPAIATKVAKSARPPPSTTSTDATVIGSESSPSRVGEKRPREDDQDGEKRSVRPRSERYEAPEGDAPGFLDWLVLPFRSFVRGFREGLSSGRE
ncbi:hypothetical protein AcW2_005153 [Taiwanofungus camphoratus]|nr:hypothetical protein AcW2_005153 [Antrodia cinnamomea]